MITLIRRKKTKRKLLLRSLILAVKMKMKPSKLILAPKMNLKARNLPPTKLSQTQKMPAKMSRTPTRV